MTRSTSSSDTAASILTLGRKSTTYSAPRYSSVWPFWRPKPLTSVTVMPCTPIPDSASRTSSSLNGLIMAVTSFMSSPLPQLLSRVISETFLDGQDQAILGKVTGARTRQGVGSAQAAGTHHGQAHHQAVDILVDGHRVGRIGIAVLDFLRADVRHDGPAGTQVKVGAEVEVAAVLAVGRAKQVGRGVRVFGRDDAEGEGAVQLEGVRADLPGRLF